MIAIGIATATYALERRRDRSNHRRDLRVEYLLTAYRHLEHASRRVSTPESNRQIEKAIADIQLLGTPHQVDFAIDFAEALAADHEANVDALLDDLRTDLRSELNLGPVSRRKFLRLKDPPGANAAMIDADDRPHGRLTR